MFQLVYPLLGSCRQLKLRASVSPIPSRADQMSSWSRPRSPTISRFLRRARFEEVTVRYAEYALELRAPVEVSTRHSDLEEVIAKRARKSKPAIPTLSDAPATVSSSWKIWADAFESEEGTDNLTDMQDSTSRAREAAEDMSVIADRKSLEENAEARALKSAACTFVEQLRRIRLEHRLRLLPRQGPVTLPAAVAAVDRPGGAGAKTPMAPRHL
jgi:hypothetical protein